MFLNSSAASFATQNHPFLRLPHGGKGRPVKGSSSNLSSRRYNHRREAIRAVINIDHTAENNAAHRRRRRRDHDELLNIHQQQNKGLGIDKFLSGKTWLVTGATGFVGKVLVEKILRSIPDTKKIYIMIKARDNQAALFRLQTEILEAKVFRVLKEEYGESYESFMLAKLVPVAGDLGRGPGLGMEPETADLVAGEVDLIVNSAANTNFDERYDVAINTNTKGGIHLMRFADKCHNLKLFLHLSTIYANGGRDGRVMEKLFSKEDTSATTTVTVPDVAAEIQLALNHHHHPTASTTDHLKRLGLERARKFGWHETYTFTKAMGEMMLGDDHGANPKVPIVILRPSIIEGTYAHPFPGWIEGNRMLDPIAQSYCKGRMTSFPGDPNSIVDVVPVDMVVNAVLAAVTRHGGAAVTTDEGSNNKNTVNVYQIGSSVSNPMTLSELFAFYYLHFNSSPVLVDGSPVRVAEPLRICSSVDEFSSGGLRPDVAASKLRDGAIRMATFYQPYLTFMGSYDCSNTEKLLDEMSEEERSEFGFDVKRIDWKHYIADVHLPGLRKHVMKERIPAKAHVY